MFAGILGISGSQSTIKLFDWYYLLAYTDCVLVVNGRNRLLDVVATAMITHSD